MNENSRQILDRLLNDDTLSDEEMKQLAEQFVATSPLSDDNMDWENASKTEIQQKLEEVMFASVPEEKRNEVCNKIASAPKNSLYDQINKSQDEDLYDQF